VKYQGESDWDFHVDGGRSAVDMSLILPHYRARHQPVDHRMSMFVANDNEPIKLKVVRRTSSSNFTLETNHISISAEVSPEPLFTSKFWQRRQMLPSGCHRISKARSIILARPRSPQALSTEYYGMCASTSQMCRRDTMKMMLSSSLGGGSHSACGTCKKIPRSVCTRSH